MKRVHEAENPGEDHPKSEKGRERIEGETTQCSKYEEMRKEEAARNRHGIVYTLRQTAMITSMRH